MHDIQIDRRLSLFEIQGETAINRYRYFYACAFLIFEGHLVAFVDEMVALDHAESTVKVYLSCINDVAKAMHAAGIATCDLDEARAIEIIAAMGWIKSRKTYARFMMKRFVRFLAERGVARECPAPASTPLAVIARLCCESAWKNDPLVLLCHKLRRLGVTLIV